LKRLFLIPVCLLTFSLMSISWVRPTENHNPVLATLHEHILNHNTDLSEVSALYNTIGLEEKGLSEKAFQYAYKGYMNLLRKKIIKEPGYLTICDFSQSSNNKRLYVVDMNNNELVMNTYVAHGCNSGAEFATRFSNKPSSRQSSLGFYVTQNTYSGEHGLSLRIEGLERGFNDKALKRNIVVHGADYIEESWLKNNNYMGRSYGCPAVPDNERNELINTIKGGTCLFIYYPSTRYLKTSKVIND
jgi:hypothetical protein